MQPDAHVIYNVAMNQNCNIDIANNFQVNDRATLQFAGSGYAPAVKIYTNCTNNISIGTDVKIAGLIYAPYANVSIYSRAHCEGALYTKQITVEPQAVISSALVDPDGDADGDGVPNAVEVFSGTDPKDPKSYKVMAIPHPSIFGQIFPQTVDYDLSEFYPEYKTLDSTQSKLQITFDSGAVSSGTKFVPVTIKNEQTDSSGKTIPGNGIPPDYHATSRVISIQPGAIPPDKWITVSIPVVSPTEAGSDVIQIAYTGNGSPNWSIVDAVVKQNPDGSTVVTAKLNSPLSIVLIARKPTAVAYLNNGTVFSNMYSKAALNVDFQINKVTATAASQYSIIYTDYNDPVNPKTDTAAGVMTLVNDSSSSYSLKVPVLQVKNSNGRIVVNQITISGNAGVNHTWTTNYPVEPGLAMTLKSSGDSVLYVNDTEAVAAIYNINYKLESFDLDGEGRVHFDNDSTYNFDFYMKDHLGSTREVVNDQGNMTEATMYYPYGTIVPLMLATPGDNAREKFTGKEFDAGENPVSEIAYNITIDSIDAGADYHGELYVNYTDLASNQSFIKEYPLQYDTAAKKFTLNTVDRFSDSVKITRLRIAATGAVTSVNYEKTCDSTIHTDEGRTITLNVNGGALISNASVNYFTCSVIYTSQRVAGSNLYYFGARYYDPVLGIWGSTDPAKEYFNPYSYVGGNPISLIDEYGFASDSVNLTDEEFAEKYEKQYEIIIYGKKDNASQADNLKINSGGIQVRGDGANWTESDRKAYQERLTKLWTNELTRIRSDQLASSNENNSKNMSEATNSGVPWAAIGSVAYNVGLGLEYPTLGSMGGNAFWNAAWSTASQSTAMFRFQVAGSKLLPVLGESAGRIALPVGIAQTTIDASVQLVAHNYKGAAVEAGVGFGSAGASMATIGALNLFDEVPGVVLITVPLSVGLGVYYGGKAIFGGKE